MTLVTVSFHVDGIPVPKGSLTRMPNGAMLPAGTAASRVRVATWREDVRAAARDAMDDADLMSGALRVMIDVTLPYPHSSIPKYKLGWMPAIKKPDIDKLARSVLDHLTGIVWKDDAQVICLAINKSYAWDDRPGAHITVDELEEVTLRNLGTAQTALRQMIAQEYP